MSDSSRYFKIGICCGPCHQICTVFQLSGSLILHAFVLTDTRNLFATEKVKSCHTKSLAESFQQAWGSSKSTWWHRTLTPSAKPPHSFTVSEGCLGKLTVCSKLQDLCILYQNCGFDETSFVNRVFGSVDRVRKRNVASFLTTDSENKSPNSGEPGEHGLKSGFTQRTNSRCWKWAPRWT